MLMVSPIYLFLIIFFKDYRKKKKVLILNWCYNTAFPNLYIYIYIIIDETKRNSNYNFKVEFQLWVSISSTGKVSDS